MPVFYCLIARGTIVLTENTTRSGNFTTVTRVLLGKINPASDGKMSYIYDDYVFHYMVEDGLTYLCLADEQQKRRIPYLLLIDIKEKFTAAYGSRAKTAIAYAMTEFARTLADRMVRSSPLARLAPACVMYDADPSVALSACRRVVPASHTGIIKRRGPGAEHFVILDNNSVWSCRARCAARLGCYGRMRSNAVLRRWLRRPPL